MKEIFVFGSNLAGRHGAGGALHAYRNCGAQYGIGRGRTGDAYAIPTKDHRIETLSLDRIRVYVSEFLDYARDNPDLRFEVTAIGTGLAGYKHEDIAPLFTNAPVNCRLPPGWRVVPTEPR